MSDEEESQNQSGTEDPAQSASEDQDADSYYGEEDMADGDLDLSFLDEEADEGEGQEKHTA